MEETKKPKKGVIDTQRNKMVCIYLDGADMWKSMTDEQAGRLVKAMIRYGMDEDVTLEDDLKLVFMMMKAQINRDFAAYQSFIERQKANGSKGGRQKNKSDNSESKKTNAFSENQLEPMETHGFSENPLEPMETQTSQIKQYNTRENNTIEDDIKEDREEVRDHRSFGDEITNEEREKRDEVYDEAEMVGLIDRKFDYSTADTLCGEYSDDWVIKAINITKMRSPDCRNWGYIEGILKKWKENGGPENDHGREETSSVFANSKMGPYERWAN